MPIPIKPIIEVLKPYAKQAAEYAATYVIEEGVKKYLKRKKRKKRRRTTSKRNKKYLPFFVVIYFTQISPPPSRPTLRVCSQLRGWRGITILGFLPNSPPGLCHTSLTFRARWAGRRLARRRQDMLCCP